jgi:hypothetical protein
MSSVPTQMALAISTGSNRMASTASDSAVATAAALGVVQDGKWMSSTSDNLIAAARWPMISGVVRAPSREASLFASLVGAPAAAATTVSNT